MTNFEESLVKIREALHKDCPYPGLFYEAVATHLIDIYNFYIVPLSVYRLMSALEVPGKHMDTIQILERVIYKSAFLGKLVRGVVRKRNPNGSYMLFALDYGVTDTEVTSDNIFELLHKNTDNIPALAQLCELTMCYPPGGGLFSENAVNVFKFFMGQDRERIYITIKEIFNEKLSVHVISSNSNPDNISTAMSYTSLSTLFQVRK